MYMYMYLDSGAWDARTQFPDKGESTGCRAGCRTAGIATAERTEEKIIIDHCFECPYTHLYLVGAYFI